MYHITNMCTYFFRIRISLYLYSPTHGNNFEQNQWWVKVPEEHFLSPSPAMPVTSPLTQIILSVKATLNATHTKAFSQALYLRLPHIAQMTEKLSVYGGGNSHSNFTMRYLCLFLEHWAPGIDMVQIFLCLYVFTLRK